ncbi:MAG TPA: catalase [Rhizomicrobium sp.]|jgi:catalase|nr:catalase [Rhizomicrobium sp.]
MPKAKKPKSAANSKDADLRRDTVPPGDALTNNQGLVVSDDQNSLKAGVRGPTLLEDFHFREKIQHFDHERIPERIVHARGAAAHGYFECTVPMGKVTAASFLSEKGKRTPVFVRFSTVAGSRGSADTPRDVRGFAAKFYTDEGIFDLVGNNIPVFFIQDAIKFPDLIHAVKPEPHNEIPQAASAHDTFWDFISLTPEAAHMMMWVMSDRALPRSLSTMEGFGIHTYRFVDAKGKSTFVKFHWKPLKGAHSLVWDESQKISGKDADFHRRDMFEAIEKGDFPEWEFGVQLVPEADEFKFDFDLLDPTKLIPEELVPVQRIGRMVLNRNPDNYFAETEQVAFHPGHVVPGIDFSNDPLLQGRLFSYLDTQLRRVGPNFAELPINRPVCPVSNNQRDAMARVAINPGKVAYFPNSLGGGCPMHQPEAVAAFRSYAEKIDGAKIRQRSESFGDHFSQATLFWNSMADWEKEHIADAFSFELNQVETLEVRQRVLNEVLVNVADDLARRVSLKTGVAIGDKDYEITAETLGALGPLKSPPKKPAAKTSPALSLAKQPGGVKGRKIAILAADGVDGKQVAAIKKAADKAGVTAELIAKFGGTIQDASGKAIPVDRPAPNAASVFYDGVIVPGGKASADAVAASGLAVHFVSEAYRHCKTVGAIGEGAQVLEKAMVASGAPGIVVAKSASGFPDAFLEALAEHRHYDRDIAGIPA